MKCPRCDFENLAEARYCGKCGMRLVRDCLTCGLANPTDYAYCHRCGGALLGDEEAPPSGEAVPARAALSAPPTPALPLVPFAQASAVSPSTDLVPDEASLSDGGLDEPLEGERRIATILLVDVRGSTDLLERLGTETWVDVMNHVFQILETEVYRFGGKVDQFRGDGLVAFFGATTAHEDDPERAVLAGLAMQNAIAPYATELAERAEIDLSLRVGVNTGEVIVTSVGNRHRHSENTAMGEAVALAARMETAAEPGTVLVSENTYLIVKEQFEWQALGEIMVKGISYPIAVYRPLRSKVEIERVDAYDLSNPLIGRDTEFEALKACVGDLQEGRGGIVTLTGERGMGKSLLVREVRNYFVRQEALLTQARDRESQPSDVPVPSGSSTIWQRSLRGRCRSYDQAHPYAMWSDLLSNWLGVREDEQKEETLDRLRRQAQALWGARMMEYYPHLATFLSLPLEAPLAEQIRQLDAEGRRQQFFLAIREWVEALTRKGPLIINFSDMHWADTTSLDLLKYCLPLCDYVPLLWLFVFRPERESPVWKLRYYLETEYPHRLTMLAMRPLNRTQSKHFIAHLVGSDVLPPETQDLIIDKAEGNPYYIQELMRSLIAQGILFRKGVDEGCADECEWQMMEAVTSLNLPDSLQTLLLARIDRLSPQEHHVLQTAAVIGPVFWCNILRALVGEDVPLQKCLTTLMRAQLIRERGRVPDLGAEYVFKSPLIRDAAYESLLSPHRAALHLKIAEYFEARFDSDSLSQYYSTIAHHYHHAERLDKELFYTLRNARLAQKVYANAEAGEHYTRALALLEVMESRVNADDEAALYNLRAQRFEVLNGRREVLSLMGRFEAMWEDARALLPLARQLPNDPTRLIDALLQQPGVADNHSRAEVETAIPMAQEALTLAQELGDRHREMEALIAIVNQRLALSDPSWLDLAERALALARQLGDQRYEARLLVGLGRLYASLDQPERSMEYLEAAAALSLSYALDDISIQSSLLALLGLEFERNGDYYQLLTEYQQEQLHLSREIGHRPLESNALMACGETQGLYLGDYEAGLNLLEECRHILDGTPREVYVLLSITQILIALEAYKEAETNLAYIRQTGDLAYDADFITLNLTELMLYIALGDEAHLQQALARADGVRERAVENPLISRQYEMAALCKAVMAYLKLAKLADDETERELYALEAFKASQSAYDLYQSFGYAQIVECVSEEVLFRHSQALAANGYADEAIKYLRWAYDEMIRKYALIPPDSAFRRTYLDNIPLHQNIRVAYAARVGSILTESGQIQQATRSTDPLEGVSS